MTATPPNQPNSPSPDLNADEILLSLRRKEGVWHDWGQSCQKLQKAGYSPQQIFEGTGFEPIHQNQLIVACQVYQSIIGQGISEAVKNRFERTGSDSLYELRILNQKERAAAAEIIVEKGLDSEGSHEVAKALKESSRFSKLPDEFPDYPGDAIAHYYWKLARAQSDLQARSRLIALALRFATSLSARQQVEKLLTDFSVSRTVSAPLLPLYRLESEGEVPKILPVAGKLPLTPADLKAVPMVEEEGPFAMVSFSGTGAYVAIPGWQVVLNAEDPVMLLADSDELTELSNDAVEEVLILVDRAQRKWDARRYFLVDNNDDLQIQWFDEPPTLPILGEIILVMRPRKVLDEDYNKDPWQLDE